MKNKRLRLLMLLPILVLGVVACDESNDEKIIYPITPEQEILHFFEEHLPVQTATKSDCFFLGNNDELSYLINSFAELQSICDCNNLPNIDFSQYSLIVGQKKVPNTSCFVSEQRIIETNIIVLELTVDSNENNYPAVSNMYYWGIYPKVANKKLNTILKE
ncbi:hypothetical protein D0T50_05240 [Bacteroides sp. 214]|uniref:hypothetical protein n=1 Tax=Bacteroides sp. 214 TaxID=2302935 RepID=UPI0013D375BB|nr:hypothetical protein [Bacteroides sp. 214]NDW12293.1 hypothetical protein [Bacteroides sp. 214]